MEFNFEIVQWAINQGFAVAVAIYSLTRLEKSMKANTDVLIKLEAILGEEGK
jgi:hypothetical protein